MVGAKRRAVGITQSRELRAGGIGHAVQVRRHPSRCREEIRVLRREQHRPIAAVRHAGDGARLPRHDRAEVAIDEGDHPLRHVLLIAQGTVHTVVPLAARAVGHHDDRAATTILRDERVHHGLDVAVRHAIGLVATSAVEEINDGVPGHARGVTRRKVHAHPRREREAAAGHSWAVGQHPDDERPLRRVHPVATCKRRRHMTRRARRGETRAAVVERRGELVVHWSRTLRCGVRA